MDFDKIVRKRASVREFSPKKPPIEQVIECIEAANLAPSPGNLPILKYIIIEDSKKIRKIAEACDQEFVGNVKILVVACSNRDNVVRMYEDNEKYTSQHVGAAVENFLLKVTELGLASCWVGFFSEYLIKELLRIPDNIHVEAVLPVGYGLKKQEKKPALDTRIHFDKYNNKYRKPVHKIRREII